MVSKKDDESPVEVQTQVAKKHFTHLRHASLRSVLLNSIPAVLFTIGAFALYTAVEEQNPFIRQFYTDGLSFVMLACIIAAVICWGLFFWIQVRNSQKRAALWRQAMESYESLVASESQFKTKEEKREASRRSLKIAEKKFNQGF